MLFVASVVIFAAYIGMQLVPVYSTNNSIQNAMELSIQDQDLRRVTRRQIVQRMSRQFSLDGVRNIIDFKSHLKVSRSRDQFIMETTYEREVPLVHNVYLTIKFNNRVERDLDGN